MNLSCLVDPSWYLAQYHDVAKAGIDPTDHYLRQGWYESRQPNWYFDPAFYGAAPDPSMCPLQHYAEEGERAGRRPSPYFDPAWYRRNFAVAPEQNCLAHYLKQRRAGGVSPVPDFDVAFYLQKYEDIAAAPIDPFMHYVTTGRAEGRLPMDDEELIGRSGLFDSNYYFLNSLDVLETGMDSLRHFCVQGQYEARNPNAYFDNAWYQRNYPDRMHPNPLTDYILLGEANGRCPSPLFDPAWYRDTYRIEAGTLALRHWLEHRRSQRFSPLPEFDVASYVAANQGRLRPNRDPFMHALTAETRRRMKEVD